MRQRAGPPASIQVFWATPRPPESVDALLTDADRVHLAWLRNDRARAESATARALLTAAAEQRLGQRVIVQRSCPSCARPHGRPEIEGLYASASHTDGRVVVAITDIAPVGVDVELDTEPRLVGLGMTVTEWTRREAVFKSQGRSDAFDPATFEPTSFEPGGRFARAGISIAVGAGYAATLYVDGDLRASVEITAADDLLAAWAASPRTARA